MKWAVPKCLGLGLVYAAVSVSVFFMQASILMTLGVLGANSVIGLAVMFGVACALQTRTWMTWLRIAIACGMLIAIPIYQAFTVECLRVPDDVPAAEVRKMKETFRVKMAVVERPDGVSLCFARHSLNREAIRESLREASER